MSVHIKTRKKMLPLAIILLLPVTAFATYNGNYQPNAPMDFNDDLKLKPNSNFVFNFEQRRRDQPSQVEMREENVGRYMYRPTTMKPVVPELNRFSSNLGSQQDLSNLLPPVTNRYNQWSPNPAQSTTMPPPPPPPVPNFADSFNNHAFSYFDNKPQQAQQLPPAQNYYQHQTPQQPSHNSPFNVNLQPPVGSDPRRNQMQSFTQHMPPTSRPIQALPTTSAPISHDFSHRFSEVPQSFPSRSQQPVASRGNHKFSWNDVTTAVPQFNLGSQPTTTVASTNPGRGPPPPVPTLTPWSDGYGK